LCLGGHIDIDVDNKTKRISVTRLHLEEDAGKLFHDIGNKNSSHVDFNRCGIPLIEIVSGPDMNTPQEASSYLKKLRNILVYLDVCDGNMQEGSFRCDANISIRPVGQKEFGTRTEMKNMNSFKAVEKALAYEIARQERLLNEGKKVVQETLLWNDIEGKTATMRSKEEAHDYRYFPEPDLRPLIVDDDWIDKARGALPELADTKKERFIKDYQIPEYDANVLTSDRNLAKYFEDVVELHNSPKKISNWMMTELLRLLNDNDMEICDLKIKPQQFANLIKLIDNNTISGKIAKDIFAKMFKDGTEPEKIMEKEGLQQVSDTSAIEAVVDNIIKNSPKEVERFKNGDTKLIAFFVGQAMKETKGKANPKILNEILLRKLKESL
jgi:aspartyl-tRNA(Asn)/glutamyl-tRNA(Gln) amidotransferase subunit B